MTRARELADLSTPKAFTVDDTYNIGINSTSPDAKLDVVGVVSATEFYGDGSNLSGITAGATLSAGSGAQRVVVTSLTSGTMTTAATDAELTYNSGTDTLSATTFSGALTGNVTGNCSGSSGSATGTAGGLSGTPDITVNNVTGAASTHSGVVKVTDATASSSTATGAVIISGGVGIAKDLYVGGEVSIAGTVTYEDVTQIDSVGIITAQKDVRVGRNFNVTGVSTLTDVVNAGKDVRVTRNFNVAGVSTFTGSMGNVTVGIITGATAIGNASGNTVYYGDGSGLTGIAAGISTEDNTQSSGLVTIDLGKDDHKFTASGICTVSCTGSGTEGGSGTLRITNSGITTIGFSTYFLWPSGSAPVLTTADGAINLISYTIQRNGSTGIGTQLLAGASLNFS